MRASADFSVAPCLLRSLRLSPVLQARMFGAILRTRLGSTSAWNPATVPSVPFVGGFAKTGMTPIDDPSIADIGLGWTADAGRMSDLAICNPTLYPVGAAVIASPALHSRTLEMQNRILLHDLRCMLP